MGVELTEKKKKIKIVHTQRASEKF